MCITSCRLQIPAVCRGWASLAAEPMQIWETVEILGSKSIDYFKVCCFVYKKKPPHHTFSPCHCLGL